jgi:O-antigen ligase/ribosomal protein S18 acetylase RimI-like enzyme
MKLTRLPRYEVARRIGRISALFAVVLSPWLFGSAEPWAYLSICLVVNVAAGMWLLSLVLRPERKTEAQRQKENAEAEGAPVPPEEPPRGLDWPALLRGLKVGIAARAVALVLLALLAFTLWQALPLPAALTKAVSPLAAEARGLQVGLFDEIQAGDFLPGGARQNEGFRTISASPSATWRSLCLLAAYVSVFVVMAHSFRRWHHLRWAAGVIATAGFIMAVFAVAQRFSGTRAIYGFYHPRYGGSIFGPFTNRNHYAAYMNMAFGVAVGLLLASLRTHDRKALKTWAGWRYWFTEGVERRALLAFEAAFMAASVCVSLSRGGIASLAVSVAVASLLMAWRGRLSLKIPAVAAVAVSVIGLLVVWLGARPVIENMGTLAAVVREPGRDSRMVAALATLGIFGKAPLFGSGFGSFQYVFPAFQSSSIQFEGQRWLHAHNDYAQLLAEGGLVGALLALVAGAALARYLWRRVSHPHARAEGKLMLAGLTISMVAIAFHSFLDYGLHKPANAFMAAAVCGMAVAAVNLGLRGRRRMVSIRTRLDSPEVRELVNQLECPADIREAKTAEILAEYRQHPDQRILGLESEGKLVGLIGLRRATLTEVVIGHIVVRRDWPRLGLGREIIANVCRMYPSANIVAETDRDAVEFYRNLGFEIKSVGEQYPGVERFRCALNAASNKKDYRLLRLGALVVLAGVVGLACVELGELRGELAYARFLSCYRLSRSLRQEMQEAAEAQEFDRAVKAVVESAAPDAELVGLYAGRNPDALWDVSRISLRWAEAEELDPRLRMSLAERAVRFGLLAVRAAPSDFDNWLCLARALDAVYLGEQAGLCLQRAQQLAPPGVSLELRPPEPKGGASRAARPAANGGGQSERGVSGAL